MIGKLRIKLILAAMMSLIVVLFVIMSVVIFLDYQKIVTDADQTLEILAQNDGFFPPMDHMEISGQTQSENGAQQKPPMRKMPSISPELPYETRYFFVILNDMGNVLSVNTGKIAAVDTDTAIEYAVSVWDKQQLQGFMKQYRYMVEQLEYEQTMILFLDCGRSLDSNRTLVLSCIGVSMIGCLLVLLLLMFLSKQIVKPFSMNYEKQKRFITDAGHELKTPLAIIQADTEILEMDWGENEWLQDIQMQTNRLSQLTNDLILLSRMDEKETSLQMLDFCVSDVLEETMQGFQSLAKMHGLHFVMDIPSSLVMHGNEDMIRKLFSILMDNAVKYSPQQKTVSCSLQQQKNQICFSVYNLAPDMTKQQTQYLFDRFFRTDESRNSETGGYGLGLSIAQAIVKAHKGKITASLDDDHILTIRVLLPKSI